MIGLMEHATVLAIMPELPPGAISVGTRIEVDHLKAVGPGATVRAWARFVKYQGRFLVFDVEARSGEHLIGRGRVFRAIVHPEEHGAKAQARVAAVNPRYFFSEICTEACVDSQASRSVHARRPDRMQS